mmetsp:Transcript_18524/g.38056  ORF Transcript_18524/g.38056 Transcript_18524/m.38056 type:complete len:208 (+) Transcript_18524:807-1430(+)
MGAVLVPSGMKSTLTRRTIVGGRFLKERRGATGSCLRGSPETGLALLTAIVSTGFACRLSGAKSSSFGWASTAILASSFLSRCFCTSFHRGGGFGHGHCGKVRGLQLLQSRCSVYWKGFSVFNHRRSQHHQQEERRNSNVRCVLLACGGFLLLLSYCSGMYSVFCILFHLYTFAFVEAPGSCKLLDCLVYSCGIGTRTSTRTVQQSS